MRIFFKHRLNTAEMVFLGVVGVVVIALSALAKTTARAPLYDVKLAAARRTLKAFAVLKKERLRRDIPIDSVNDPALSGLIGYKDSPITTTTGDLLAKQMTINPNWAALVVELLREAKVKRGDYVAVHMTGSFPALNVATLIAIETYGAIPVWVSSAGSSSWGANIPDFTWPDMEKALREKGVIKGASLLVSLGGNNDVGAGLPEEGRRMLREAIRRNGYRLLEVLPLQRSVDAKYSALKGAAKGKIRAFINIGGGVASLGSHEVGELLNPGVNWPRTYTDLSLSDYPVEGLVAKFLKEGAPVIHLLHVRTLAKRYGLPLVVAAMPEVGEGRLFFEERYVLWVQALLLFGYLVLVFLVVNGYLGRFFGNPRKEEETV